jgi:tetratricopeptide (TPR) repeat protein
VQAPFAKKGNGMAKVMALPTVRMAARSEQESLRHSPPLMDGVFVGREREMAALRANLEDAVAGCGRLVLLVGEPGIGKTRTAHELAAHAQARGARVFTGRCYEGGGAPPFWPWIQIVRAYLHDCDLDTLRADLGAGAADIAQVIMEVRERFPQLPASLTLESEHARFRFFDSFTTFLKNVAHARPLVLLLDDLHWADASSLLLLQFLVQELGDAPLLIIGAYRNVELELHHPLRQALGELARESGSQTILLRGLTERDVACFMQNTTGLSPDERLIAAVHQQTDGNPFFLTEVVRLLASEGQHSQIPAPQSLSALPIPQRVYDVISRRLVRLSEVCFSVLTLASVIGRGFTLDVLTRASGLSGTQILQSLEEAIVARVVTAERQTIGSYSFSHALMRETLYSELTLTQRVAFHRQVGEALESLHGADPAPHLTGMAYHFFVAAQSGADVTKAIAYATQAGARATTLLAYEEATKHFESALRLLDLKEPDEIQRCDLLLALGEAQAKAGETQKARETFQQAATVARKRGNSQQLARSALGFGNDTWEEVPMVDEPLITLLEEALAAIGEGDSTIHVRLLGRLAVALYYADARDRRLALSQEALEMARRLGDPTTLASALHARHWALWGHEKVQERLGVATEIVRLAEAVGARELALTGRAWRIANLLHLGDIATADAEFDAYTRLAAQLRRPFYQWRVLVFRAMRAFLAGRFAEGEDFAQQAAAIGQRAQPQVAIEIFGAQLFFLRQEQKRLQELAPMFEGFVEQYPTAPVLRSGLAVLYCELGRVVEARREFAHLAANQFASLPHDATWIDGVCALAVVCAFLGDAQHARTLYEFLRPYAEQSIVVGAVGAIVHIGATTRYLGILASTMGRWEDAERHFVDALERNTRMDARPWVAYTQYEYAQMLLARNQSDDSEKAHALLDLAFATARELEMINLQSKIQRLQSTVKSNEKQKAKGEKTEIVIENSQLCHTGSETLDGGSQSLIPPSPLLGHYLLRREGDYWTIADHEVNFRLRHLRGLDYIAQLLQHPNVEFHVLDLVSHAHMIASSPASAQGAAHVETSAPVFRLGGADVLLDVQAREAYRQRLVELREELEEAHSFNDLGRADKAQQEIDFISAELTHGVGLGGRPRNAPSSAERARVNVVKGIKIVLAKIAEHSPFLEHYLATSIKTGVFCSYTPPPFNPISWEI